MATKRKRIALATSGGTAAPMSAVLKFLVLLLTFFGYEVWIIPEVWKTMTRTGSLKPFLATEKMVEFWDRIGGAPFAPSCKNTNVFKINLGNNEYADYSERVYNFYKDYNFECIVLVGGGGTTHQVSELKEKYPDMKFFVLLATLDNDVMMFNYTLGFDTAVKVASETIASLYWDSLTMRRQGLMTTMGYDCGRLAMAATHRAINEYNIKVDSLYLPETKIPIEEFAKKIKQGFSGKEPIFIVAAEGVCASSANGLQGNHNNYKIEEFVSILESVSEIDFKHDKVDYRQRAWIPTKFDIKIAENYAKRTCQFINAVVYDKVIGGTTASFYNVEEVSVSLKKQSTVQDPITAWLKGIEGYDDLKNYLSF